MTAVAGAWSAHATLDGSCDTGVVWAVGMSSGGVTTALRAVGVSVRRRWLKLQAALPPELAGTDVETGEAVAFRFDGDSEWRLLPVPSGSG